ncbi:MAG: signal peptidase II [Acidiferrobacterales bacterium]
MAKFWLIAVVIVILDQLSKLAAVKYLLRGSVEVAPFLNLVLVFNSGAAFGFLSGASGWQNLLFVGIAIVVAFVIIMMVKRLGANDVQVLTGLMLILGGAVGNLIDRLRNGYVVDFIDFHFQDWHWPAFNVADSAITIGAILLVLDAIGVGLRKRYDKQRGGDYDS